MHSTEVELLELREQFLLRDYGLSGMLAFRARLLGLSVFLRLRRSFALPLAPMLHSRPVVVLSAVHRVFRQRPWTVMAFPDNLSRRIRPYVIFDENESVLVEMGGEGLGPEI